MPRVIERTVYRFHELSDRAKARARDHYRDHDLQHEWWDYTYEQAVEAAGMLGITIFTKTVKLVNGKDRQDPRIYFSGFSSQGDGASFEGRYSPRPGSEAVDEIANEFVTDSELHRIAEQLALLQVSARIKHGQKLGADTKLGGSGYCHSGMMEVTVYFDVDDTDDPEPEDVEQLTQLMRDFADWIYSQLEAEHNYLTSDEHIDEALLDGDNEFEESGELV